MNKRVIIQTAVIAVSFVAVPAVVNARRGADDPIGHVRQENRRQDNAVQGTSTTPTVINNNVPTQDDNPSSSDSTSSSSTSSSNSTTTTTPQVAGAVTLAEAKVIANSTLPNKTFEKAEQETEHGVAVWSIRYTDGSRVDVAVANGDVMRVRDEANDRVDSDDDDSDEDDDHSGRGRGGDDD